jgi:hypothetical protein
MAFSTYPDAANRLHRDPKPLTKDEIPEFFRFASVMQPGDVRILEAHLALLTMEAVDANRKAIENFDRSSKLLARRVYWLTWALVLLTLVILLLMGIPLLRG